MLCESALPGNWPGVYRLRAFTDRAWFEGGLGIKERFRLEQYLVREHLSCEEYSRLLGMWGVKYVLEFESVKTACMEVMQTYSMPNFFDGPLMIVENKAVLPRAYLTSALSYVDTAQNAIKKIASKSFVPQDEAVVYGKSTLYVKEEIADRRDVNMRNNKVDILEDKDEGVVMSVTTDLNKYLVFSDTYYPGWKVYVDGKEKNVIRVNLVQRAVEVTEGVHRVEWRYEPMSFEFGLEISIISGVGLLIYFGWVIVQQRSRSDLMI